MFLVVGYARYPAPLDNVADFRQCNAESVGHFDGSIPVIIPGYQSVAYLRVDMFHVVTFHRAHKGGVSLEVPKSVQKVCEKYIKSIQKSIYKLLIYKGFYLFHHLFVEGDTVSS